jgi:hypothetical protein
MFLLKYFLSSYHKEPGMKLMYVYMYVYIHTHTHTHTYIYIYVYTCPHIQICRSFLYPANERWSCRQDISYVHNNNAPPGKKKVSPCPIINTALHFNCCFPQTLSQLNINLFLLYCSSTRNMINHKLEKNIYHAIWNVRHKDDIKWNLTAEFIPQLTHTYI